jgi:hypothetical protein
MVCYNSSLAGINAFKTSHVTLGQNDDSDPPKCVQFLPFFSHSSCQGAEAVVPLGGCTVLVISAKGAHQQNLVQ